MKKVAIINNSNSPVIEAIRARLNNIAVDCFETADDGLNSYDLIVSCGGRYVENSKYNILASHYSLLPSFESIEPVKDAIIAGVKVTGITVFYTNPRRIVAQYPIFIHNDMHYDEIEKQLEYIEQIFFPLIIEKILNNEQFESQTIMQSQTCDNCKDCNKCSK